MKRCAIEILVSLFITSFVTASFAQQKPPILTDEKLQKGIYRDFHEFLDNAPSIRRPFEIVLPYANRNDKKMSGDYQVVLLDSTVKRKGLAAIWGACDGEAVYINELAWEAPLNFKKLMGIGRYCYLMGSLPFAKSAGAIGGAIGGAVAEVSGDNTPYILNINNGSFYQLDKGLLRKILAKDQELLSLYEKENKPGDPTVLLSYIEKYNELHADEIKYNGPSPYILTFYRREKKERPEPILLNVNDSIPISLKPNSIKQVSVMVSKVEVCAGSRCQTVSLLKSETNYVECSWNAEELEFKKVQRKEGQHHEREIVALRKKN